MWAVLQSSVQTELLEENGCLLVTKQDAKRRDRRLPPI